MTKYKSIPLHDRLQVINLCKPGTGNAQCRYLGANTKTLGPDDVFAGEEVSAYCCYRDDLEAKKIIDTEVAMVKLKLATGKIELRDSPLGKGCPKTNLDIQSRKRYFDSDAVGEVISEVISKDSKDKEVSMLPCSDPIEPIDHLMSEIIHDALKHTKTFVFSGTCTKPEIIGHFVTFLRRRISHEISLAGHSFMIGSYYKIDVLRFIQSRILNTSIWGDLGIINPQKFSSCEHYFQNQKSFRMTAERIHSWTGAPKDDDEDDAYREIDRALSEMQASIDNMNHHTEIIEKVNIQGGSVIRSFKEAVASVYGDR